MICQTLLIDWYCMRVLDSNKDIMFRKAGNTNGHTCNIAHLNYYKFIADLTRNTRKYLLRINRVYSTCHTWVSVNIVIFSNNQTP